MDLPPWERVTRSDVEHMLSHKADQFHTHNGLESLLSIVRELRQNQETDRQELAQLRTELDELRRQQALDSNYR